MIEFAHPFAFLLLPLPIAVYFLIPPYRKSVSALRFPYFRRIAKATGREPGPGSIILSRHFVQMASAVAVWILVIGALAQPEVVGDPIIEEKAARDVLLAIDISGSMDQVDFPAADGERVQRLEAVKRVVGDFIRSRDSDRVALIVFGAKAFVQAPFTEDLASVRALLDQTQVGMAGPHTVIGDAIGLSIKTFQASQITDRLLILLSDGGDTGSRMTPVNAAGIAAREGIEIATIGVGDPNGTGDQQLDERTLRDIASAAGGEYYFAADETALEEIYERIDALNPRSVETVSFRPRESLAHYLLGFAVIIGALATGFLLLTRQQRRLA